MSEVKGSDPVYVPAVFPSKGRLPCDVTAVRANYRQQMAEERRHRQEESAARGGPGALTCAHSLHISLFFDGTQNNQHDSVSKESRLFQTFFLRNSIINTKE